MARWEFAFVLERGSGASLSQQIARGLLAEIQRGRLHPGDRLPGSRTLARTLQVHRQTVVSALEELVAEGWLTSKPGSGTFVAEAGREPSLALGRRSRPRAAAARRFPLALATAPEPELPRTAAPGEILMSGSRPDVRLLPAELVGRAYRRVLRRSRHLLSYAHPAGLAELRTGLAAMLSSTRGLPVVAENVLVTRGSQMALALAARALVRPGDRIAVEHPGYRPAWEAFRAAGAEIVPVGVDDHGLDVRALRAIVRRRGIRAVYVTPHHQYPTTVTLSGPRRLALLRLAAEARFAVLEDDYDHEFHYGGRPLLPIASADADGLVVYIGTLSKVLAPGLRIGFVAATPDLVERMTSYRSFVDLQGDAVLEAAIAELLADGLLQRHVRKMQRTYRSRMERLATELRRLPSGFLSFRKPAGGTAIWATTRDAATTTAWTEAARSRGVLFDGGSDFTLGGAESNGVRLGFACLDEDELSAAAARLAAAAEAVRRRSAGPRRGRLA